MAFIICNAVCNAGLSEGNADLLLLAPSSRSRPPDAVLRQNLRVMDPAESVETLIGQKLQLIGDQFYQEHMMVSLEIWERVFVLWIIITLCLV